MALLESDLQAAVFSWAATMDPKYPCLKWLHAVPNGGFRTAKEAVGLQRQGVKAGILDLALDVARGGFHGLKIELKKPGGKCKAPSKDQLEYMTFCYEQGYYAFVSNDFEEVKTRIMEYLDGKIVQGLLQD